MKAIRCASIALAVWLSILFSGLAQQLDIVSYNVESGGANANEVAKRLARESGCEIWGLCEVQNQSWSSTFETAAEDGENADFKAILGTTGGGDRLVIIYNSDVLEALETNELHQINLGGNVRSPLVVKFKHKTGGSQFYFIVNHLHRSNSANRHSQATLLNDWAARQQLPVITCGDFNFDWAVTNGDIDHDAGYDNMVKNDVFKWVRPASLIRTQDSNFDSVLDFVFASRDAKTWALDSTIVVEPGDFPNTNQTSDHRPIRARFNLSGTAPISKQQILDRIKELQQQVDALKRLIEQLP